MILGQLCFMESFVEDMLNLRLLKEGIMTIAKEKFDSFECLESIVSMFAIKSELQGVTVSYSFVKHLAIPDANSYKLDICNNDSQLIVMS